jgi:hypothetical protein
MWARSLRLANISRKNAAGMDSAPGWSMNRLTQTPSYGTTRSPRMAPITVVFYACLAVLVVVVLFVGTVWTVYE